MAVAMLIALTVLACGHKYETIDARYIEDSERRMMADLDGPTAESISAEDSLLDLDSTPRRELTEAVTLYRQGRLNGAAELLEKVLACDQREWRAAYYLGLIKTSQKEYERADSYLHQSLEYGPSDDQLRALIYVALGHNCESRRDLGRARQHFLTALYLDPRSPAANDGIKRLSLLARDDN